MVSNFRELSSSANITFTTLEIAEVRLQGPLPRLLAQDVHQGLPGAHCTQGLPASYAAPLHETSLAQGRDFCATLGTPNHPFKNLPTHRSSPRYDSIPKTPPHHGKPRRRHCSTPYSKKIHLTEKDTRRRTKGIYSLLIYFIFVVEILLILSVKLPFGGTVSYFLLE